MKKLIFIVLLLITVVGCSQQNSTVPQGDFPPSPSGIIIIDEIEYEMEVGNFRWERKLGSDIEVAQTDASTPNQIAEHFKSISVDKNSLIDIVIEDNPEITVYLWNGDERIKELTLNDNQITVPSSNGHYIYEAIGKWSNGEVSYTFVIETK